MTFVSNFIFLFHTIIMITNWFGPYILPIKYLKYYIFLTTLMVLQWFIFGGCILTTMETGKTEEDFINRMIKKLTGYEIDQKN